MRNKVSKQEEVFGDKPSPSGAPDGLAIIIDQQFSSMGKKWGNWIKDNTALSSLNKEHLMSQNWYFVLKKLKILGNKAKDNEWGVCFKRNVKIIFKDGVDYKIGNLQKLLRALKTWNLV